MILSPQLSTQLSRQVLVEGKHIVDIPEGWRLVKGTVRKGDRCVNCVKLASGVVEWNEVQDLTRDYYDDADVYGCVIRECDR
jgi:hypothetical protein